MILLNIILCCLISTHSPRVGRTVEVQHTTGQRCRFQLTRPVWGEPLFSCPVGYLADISTHSPRVGRTEKTSCNCERNGNFNSLAPCGANPQIRRSKLIGREFQLTRPVWGEPRSALHDSVPKRFQLTRPVWGEPTLDNEVFGDYTFQLTRPVWGEPLYRNGASFCGSISTHSPRVGRTFGLGSRFLRGFLFQLTRPVWGEPGDG